jgi:GAF domain-containing protein
MLARGHRLAIGAKSIVGTAIHSGRPRVALKAGVDAIYFDNPDLPDTRSQIALPLIARGQIIGALDVQSSAAEAFDQEEVAVLSALADQIAVALDNARLYEASQAALVQMQMIQRQYTGETWSQYGARRESDLFEYRPAGPVEEATAPGDGPSAGAGELSELEKALSQGSTAVTSDDNRQGTALVAPIKVRGQVIGALGLQDQEQGRAWSDEEITLVETIADQVAQAMEAARLFDETQRRAQRERRVGEIATKIRAAADIDGILRTTVQEIRRALGVSHGIIRLGTETHLQPPADPGSEGGHGDE